MRLTHIALALALAGCAASPPPAPPSPPDPAVLADGAFAYGFRCKGCHEPATPGAKTRDELAAMKPDDIVKALTTGKMKLLATDMPESEARAIALYLTTKS